MNTLTYFEDPKKRKTSLIIAIVGSLAALVIGVILLVSSEEIGIVDAALGGGMSVVGITGLFSGLKDLPKLKKPPAVILFAHKKGIEINIGRSAKRLIPWEDIESIKPAQRGVQKAVALLLKEPDKYFISLSHEERKLANQNKKFFGSFASIKTNLCTASNEEISTELNKYLQLI